MANSGSSCGLEEIITCVICGQLYQDSVILDCSHNFCRRCLCSHDDRGSHIFKVQVCPVCHKSIEISACDLRENSVLNEIVKIMKSVPERQYGASADVSCQLCNSVLESTSGSFCADCNIIYCSSCFDKYHPNIGVMSGHKIEKLFERVDRVRSLTECPFHKKELVYFCLDCRLAICYHCHSTCHKDHKCEMLSKALSKALIKTTSKIENAKAMNATNTETVDANTRYLESLERKHQTRIFCIRECFEAVREALDAKEIELLQKEEDTIGKPLQKFKKELEKMSRDIVSLQSAVTVTETILKEGEAAILLFCSKPVLDGIKYYRQTLSAVILNDAEKLLSPHKQMDVGQILENISYLGDELFTPQSSDPEGCSVEDDVVPTHLQCSSEEISSELTPDFVTEKYQSDEEYWKGEHYIVPVFMKKKETKRRKKKKSNHRS